MVGVEAPTVTNKNLLGLGLQRLKTTAQGPELYTDIMVHIP